MGERVKEREWLLISQLQCCGFSPSLSFALGNCHNISHRRLLFGWCPLWIESFSSPYAAGVQQAAAFQLNWRDLSDPKRSVATSDRTLPVLPSSLLSLSPSVPTLPPTPPLLGTGRTGESCPHSAGRQASSKHKLCPFIAATSHFQLLSLSACALDSSVR